eukprot:m.52476 g.52476  ORF g.52476 m.52476 type:complete len:143 (+) comp18284_c0_seq2:1339-1767(+)
MEPSCAQRRTMSKRPSQQVRPIELMVPYFYNFHISLFFSFENTTLFCHIQGKSSGDLVHPMPWCPELFNPEFHSVVADMKNSVKNRSNAQVSCAGQFIANHLPKGFAEEKTWLHIDMAGPVHHEERGTGFGVALLLQLFAYS